MTSLRLIAQVLGVSKSTVHRDLQRDPDRGTFARSRGRDGKLYPSRRGLYGPADWMLELREQGWSYRRIAAEAGVSHQTVMRLFKNQELVQVSHMGQVEQQDSLVQPDPAGSGVPHGTGGAS